MLRCVFNTKHNTQDTKPIVLPHPNATNKHNNKKNQLNNRQEKKRKRLIKHKKKSKK